MTSSIRKTITAAVLAMAATVGLAVGTAAPASAGSCTQLLSVDGTTTKTFSRSLNTYTLNITPTARLGASNCFAGFYRSTVYIYKGSTIYAQKTSYGTDANGARSFATLSIVVADSTTQMGVGIKTEIYNGSTWEARDRDGWGVFVPNTTFNSATGQSIVDGGCNSTEDPEAVKPRSYSEWCAALLPF